VGSNPTLTAILFMKFLLFFALTFCLSAQIDNNANAWFMYFGDHAFGQSKFGAHLEGQWRRSNLSLAPQQLFVRPALNFQLRPKLMLTAGYAFAKTHRYGSFPPQKVFDEHRIYQQIQVQNRWLGLDWQNRLRFEQRHILGFAARYENRFRYALRANIPLRWGGGKNYVAIYDEIFFNYGKQVGANVFDQNRAYVAWGHHLSKQQRFEIGFMEQTLQQRSGRVTEHNHTLQLALYSRLPFGRRK
jgi:hypothetical protein